ncbi:zinc finger protein 770-like [Bradysia coprophila]|uniref:zinc finger protein 770-like n=1 Tax=Bradysia coprophila TaxID=38358 RepID=UPI00187D7A24|nr:zinc finger protein 770-like [Bradysia coprophila]
MNSDLIDDLIDVKVKCENPADEDDYFEEPSVSRTIICRANEINKFEITIGDTELTESKGWVLHSIADKDIIKTHGCQKCSRKFKTSVILMRHMVVHRDFECFACSKTFKKLGALKHHMLVHADKRPFQCDDCPKKFDSIDNLKKHMLVHTVWKKFGCNECSKRFRTNSHLTEPCLFMSTKK